MKGAEIGKRKSVVNIAALQLFLEEFDPDAIRALAQLCEMGTEHPDFGKPGFPDGHDFMAADQATDALFLFFCDKCYVDEPGDNPPKFTVDIERGTIEIPAFCPPRKPKPSVRRAKPDVPVRLLKAAHAKN